jgi:hypothetical protein
MSVPFGGKALGTNELKIEEANRLNELEKSQQFAYSEAGKLKKSIAMSDVSMSAEMMGGMGYTDDYLRSATAGIGGLRGTRTPIKEALSSLDVAQRLGIMDVVKGATDRRVTRATPITTSEYLKGRDFEAKQAEDKIKKLDKLIEKAETRQKESMFGGAFRGDDDYDWDFGGKVVGSLHGNPMLGPQEAARKFKDIRSGLVNQVQTIANQKKSFIEGGLKKDITEDYYSDLGNFVRDPKYFAVSEDARNELFKQFQRRNAQNVMSGMSAAEAEQKATTDTFRGDLGVYRGQLGKDVGGDYYAAKQAQDFAASLQSQTFNPVSAATVAAPAISAIDAARQNPQFEQFTPQEKLKMGTDAQQEFQKEVARPFGMVEQLTQVAFSKLGIGWGAHRTRLQDLMQKGRIDEVVSIVSDYQKRTGKGDGDRESIYATLNEPRDTRNKSAEQMYDTVDPLTPEWKSHGYAPTSHAVLTGYDTSASGSAAGGEAFFGMKLKDPATGKELAEPFKMSGQQLTTSDETAQASATLDVIKNLESVLSSRLGDAASQAVFNSISKGFTRIADEIRSAIKPTADDTVPMVNKVDPVKGVMEEGN